MRPLKTAALILSGVIILSLTLLGCAQPPGQVDSKTLAETYTRTEVVTSSVAAKKLLVEGNQRFTSGQLLAKDLGAQRRSYLKQKGQHPIAVIVSCSDSRVPPELVFDQGLGDLFEIRVAGNVIDRVGIESIEYALEHLNTPLVVVLGHEKCGAVTSTVQAVNKQTGTIMQKIEPSLLKAQGLGLQGERLIEKTSELNIAQSIEELKKNAKVRELLDQGQLAIQGAKYNLASGKVEWLD